MADANSRTCTVYALFASDDGEIRYVGQTVRSLHVRLSNHIAESRRKRSRRNLWLREVMERGGEVLAFVLRADATWDRDERALIAAYRAAGVPLVNSTSGGQGVMDPPLDVRAKIAASKRGKARPEQMRKRMSEVNRKRFADPAERARIGDLTRQAMATNEVREKIAAGQRARWTEEARRLQGERNRKRALQPGYQAVASRARAKMTDEQVLEARTLAKQGARVMELCRKYGITSCPMSLLLRGKTFQHVPMP